MCHTNASALSINRIIDKAIKHLRLVLGGLCGAIFAHEVVLYGHGHEEIAGGKCPEAQVVISIFGQGGTVGVDAHESFKTKGSRYHIAHNLPNFGIA